MSKHKHKEGGDMSYLISPEEEVKVSSFRVMEKYIIT